MLKAPSPPRRGLQPFYDSEHYMPETHDSKPFVFHRGPLIVSLESVFWHTQKYPRRRVSPATPPLSEPASPRELYDPYRRGHGRVFRFPLTRRAIVIGYWVPAEHDVLSEEEGDKLLEAVEGTHIPGITADDIRSWAAARRWSLWERILRWWGVVRPEKGSGGVQIGGFLPPQGDEVELRPWTEADDAAIIDLEDARSKPWPS